MSSDFFTGVPERSWLLGTFAVWGVLALGGFYWFRRWVAGGVCRSQAKLDGKTVIITGGNTGIGLETAVDLAKRNARVILACRSVERGERSAVEVRKRSGNDNVAFVQLDLASLDSVRKFTVKILEEEPRIDILINNAGMHSPYVSRTIDGFERHMCVNHLGPFLLTNLLLDRLKEAPSARIVNVSSILYKRCNEFDFNQMNSVDIRRVGKRNNIAYNQTKLANILFTRAFAKRLAGTNVTINALHPGVIKTDLARDTISTYSWFGRVSSVCSVQCWISFFFFFFFGSCGK